MFDSSDEETDSPDNTDSLQIDWINIFNEGEITSIAVSSLPGCRFSNIHHSLTKDLETIERENISDVLVLVTRGELHKYRVPNLLAKYDSRGLCVHHYPIEDGLSPTIDCMMNVIFCLKRLLDTRKKVLVHCMGGLGRAGVVAACLLQYLDEHITPDNTIALLRGIRGPRAIQTIKQYNFVHDFRTLHHRWSMEDMERCVSR